MKKMARKGSVIFLVISLLFSLTGCGGMGADAAMTQEEIEARLNELAAEYPSAEADRITLSQTVSGEAPEYSADIDLTWTAKVGRFSTEKALEQYSRNFAASVSRRAPGVSRVVLSWMVPYHSEAEPSMEFVFEKSDGVLKQSELTDRFTDGTFGADAYADAAAAAETPAAAPAEASILRNTAASGAVVYDASDPLIQGLHLPHHKTIVLPFSFEPRHKTSVSPIYYGPRHKSGFYVVKYAEGTAAASEGTAAAGQP